MLDLNWASWYRGADRTGRPISLPGLAMAATAAMTAAAAAAIEEEGAEAEETEAARARQSPDYNLQS